jgi:hypothetical protein
VFLHVFTTDVFGDISQWLFLAASAFSTTAFGHLLPEQVQQDELNRVLMLVTAKATYTNQGCTNRDLHALSFDKNNIQHQAIIKATTSNSMLIKASTRTTSNIKQ